MKFSNINPQNLSLAQIREEAFEQGRKAAFEECAAMMREGITEDNICDEIDREWCDQRCASDGITGECILWFLNSRGRKNDK